jgi:hypothetical protein
MPIPATPDPATQRQAAAIRAQHDAASLAEAQAPQIRVHYRVLAEKDSSSLEAGMNELAAQGYRCTSITAEGGFIIAVMEGSQFVGTPPTR